MRSHQGRWTYKLQEAAHRRYHGAAQGFQKCGAGYGAMTEFIFAVRAELSRAAIERGYVEQGVIAETVLAPWLEQNFALPATLADHWHGIESMAQVHQHALEAGAALICRHAGQFGQQALVIAGVPFTGVARRVNTGFPPR